jgi:exoribonuclease-2
MTLKQETNLTTIAYQVMKDRGFIPDFSPAVINELSIIQKNYSLGNAKHDHRDKLWVSIDNSDSKDLDQLTFAETDASGTYKLYVAIADVDGLVKKNSQIDGRAGQNTTSVYTPSIIFPMLPLELSTNLTSLNENADRQAVVVEIHVAADGGFELHDTYMALVRNHAKLAYDSVADWLESHKSLLNFSQEVHQQLTLQDQIARLIQDYRNRQGALNFETIEILPIMKDNMPVGLAAAVHNRAHELIENCMIAANASLSKYLEQKGVPILKRIVREPKRWDRIVELAKTLNTSLPAEPDAKALQNFLLKQRASNPAQFSELSLAMIKLIGRGEYILSAPGQNSPGHFDLALQDYAHTTAPNRRYPDLIMQRLLKSHLNGQALPYKTKELSTIASYCTQKEDDATKVERHLRKSAAAIVMITQIGKKFQGLVTGASEKGTWVKIKNPPIEGKLVQGSANLDVGDSVEVELIAVDVAQGHIDFATA